MDLFLFCLSISSFLVCSTAINIAATTRSTASALGDVPPNTPVNTDAVTCSIEGMFFAHIFDGLDWIDVFFPFLFFFCLFVCVPTFSGLRVVDLYVSVDACSCVVV